MTIEQLLDRHARRHAAARAARLAAGLALAGAALVALALAASRMGMPVPLPWRPEAPGAGQPVERLLGWLAVSTTGLLQGAALLVIVLVCAGLLRVAGPLLLRAGRRETARRLDRATGGDRFLAAAEAGGAFAPLVRSRALAQAPPPAALAGRPPGRGSRWLFRLLVLLVLAVALAPGTAPGPDGDAAVAGTPRDAQGGVAVRLTLRGPQGAIDPATGIPIEVVLEAAEAPETDVDLPLAIRIDEGPLQDTHARLLLPAGAPGADRVAGDLRAFLDGIGPGDHVAVAHAGPLRSNAYRFTIEPRGAGAPPPSGAQPPPPEPRPEEGGPRPGWKPEYVEPLRREGETVRKRARVPVEAPGGGAPVERPLDEAWPELEARREAALRRPGLSPDARRLVREYYDRLRPPEAPR